MGMRILLSALLALTAPVLCLGSASAFCGLRTQQVAAAAGGHCHEAPAPAPAKSEHGGMCCCPSAVFASPAAGPDLPVVLRPAPVETPAPAPRLSLVVESQAPATGPPGSAPPSERAPPRA